MNHFFFFLLNKLKEEKINNNKIKTYNKQMYENMHKEKSLKKKKNSWIIWGRGEGGGGQ